MQRLTGFVNEMKYGLGIGVDLNSESDEMLSYRSKDCSWAYYIALFGGISMAAIGAPLIGGGLAWIGVAEILTGGYFSEKGKQCDVILEQRAHESL